MDYFSSYINKIIDFVYPHDEWTQDDKMQNPFSGIYQVNISCATHSEPICSIKSLCVVDGNLLEPKPVTVDCQECGIRAKGKRAFLTIHERGAGDLGEYLPPVRAAGDGDHRALWRAA